MKSMQRRWDDFACDHPRLAGVLRRVRSVLPPLNFITIHYAYFIVVSLICSLIFWGSSDPGFSISYTDSLFLVVSAMTEAGLNTVNLSQMTTWQQILLWLLIIFGSTIWVSIWTVAARKHAFEQRFEDIVRADRMHRLRRPGSSVSLGNLGPLGRLLSFSKAQTTPPSSSLFPTMGSRMAARAPPDGPLQGMSVDDLPMQRATTLPVSPLSSAPPPRRHVPPSTEDIAPDEDPDSLAPVPEAETAAAAAVGGFSEDSQAPFATRVAFVDRPHPNRPRAPSFSSIYSLENRPGRSNAATAAVDAQTARPDAGGSEEKSRGDHWSIPFLTSRTVGRNAQFYGLSSEERERIGGCEYRALKILAVVVPLYFVLWQLLGCVAVGAWIARYMPEVATSNGINPWWAGIFNGVSAFNNSGMSLLDANMIPFENAYFVLITMGLMILAGNTAYPIFLRLIFWTGLRLLRLLTLEDACGDWKATLEFILKYPRRVYTNLFPARPTWWLLFMLIWLNCIDWVSFELLNLGNPTTEAISPGSRVIDGLFQALAVRSGGFYVVSISGLYIGLQVLYVIMMYISVYPVVITMRHSNVYEERSLGIYDEDSSTSSDPEMGELPTFVSSLSAASTAIDATAGTGTDATPAPPGSPASAAVTGTGTSPASPQSRIRRRLTASSTEIGHMLRSTIVPWHGVGVPPSRPSAAPDQPRGDRPASSSGGGGGGGGQPPTPAESRISFISQQVHGQLAHDIWWLVLAVLVISTIETSHFLAQPVVYSVFNIVFEVVSAYGCVGISVGVPWAAYSFSGGWHGASKLVLCLVMLRGRHRGLPVALDRAVRLPGAQLERDEEEDHRIRRSMTTSRRFSIDGLQMG